MCGLSGNIIQHLGGYTHPQLNAAMANIFITQLRGGDSTGVVGISSKGQSTSIKEVGPPNILFSKPEWKTFYDAMFQSGQVLFAHNRAATRGDISIENAHPFYAPKLNKKGKILLVHNGTLTTYQELPGLNSFKVDSDWLTHCLAEYGPTETFGKVNGPIATIWWDTELKTLNIFRNGERPLFFVQEKGNGHIHINSEQAPLIWLKHHCHLDFENDTITEFKPLVHYSLKHGSYRDDWTKKETPRIYKITPPSRPHSSSVTINRDNLFEFRRNKFRPPQFNTFLSVTEWETRARSFDLDCKYMLLGHQLTEVAWIGGSRRTLLTNGQFFTPNQEPYKTNLVRMSPVGDGRRINCFFEKEGTKYECIEIPILDLDTPAILLPPHLADVDTSKSVAEHIGGDFICGTRRKWHSKGTDSGKKKVAHWAQISPNHHRHFLEYFNSMDGKIEVGQEVGIEADSYVMRDGNSLMYEIEGKRLQSEEDEFIRCYFYSKGRTKLDLEAAGMFYGKIAQIRLATVREFNMHGVIVMVLLANVEDLDDWTAAKEVADDEKLHQVETVSSGGHNPNAA